MNVDLYRGKYIVVCMHMHNMRLVWFLILKFVISEGTDLNVMNVMHKYQNHMNVEGQDYLQQTLRQNLVEN